MFFLKKTPTPPPTIRRALLAIEGRDVEVVVRYSRLAKRMSVKVHPMSGEVVVVTPSRRTFEAAMAFAETESAWIAHQLAKIPSRLRLAPGLSIPLRGREYLIVYDDKIRLTVRDDDRGVIRVGGRLEHAPRRILDFLKKQARSDFEACVATHSARLGGRVRHISLRDPVGRWGSCSASRGLSFSWRLILAPPFVLDYVAAHEVAHLSQMNHGPKFWALVRELYGDPKPPQAWLAVHGPALHRYGCDP